MFTIGHSNEPLDEFIGLLTAQAIDLVVDVRSKPQSRFFPHFNRRALGDHLVECGIEYEYMGDELGGHPPEKELYDEKGHVVYERVAKLRRFRNGIKTIARLCEQRRVALMCTEEVPAKCHRHPLLAVMLLERDVNVLHIRRDGSLQDAGELLRQDIAQLPLVEPPGEDSGWHSPKRIRH